MLGLLGEQGSDFAYKVDYANDVVTIISVLCTVAIVGTMLYFAVIYRQRNGKDHEQIFSDIFTAHSLEMVKQQVIFNLMMVRYFMVVDLTS